MQPIAAITSSPAGGDPSDGFGFVADSYLTHLYADVELSRQVSHISPKIDTLFGGEVEEQLFSVHGVLHVHQLHQKLMIVQNLPGANQHPLFVRAPQVMFLDLGRVGQLHKLHFLQHGLGASRVFVAGLVETRAPVLRLLLLGQGPAQQGHFQAPDRLDDDPASRFRPGLADIHQSKITRFTENRQIYVQKEVPP